MHVKSQIAVVDASGQEEVDKEDPLQPLITGQFTKGEVEPFTGVVIGELLAVSDDGLTPFVAFPRQTGSGAVRARTTVDLHGGHIGGHVVLMFEGADAARPIVVGVIRDGGREPLDSRPGRVDVEADGERLVVSAKRQLVLRCGKARITLTHAGKVLIEGAYISSRSSGVNRIKGGSIQLN